MGVRGLFSFLKSKSDVVHLKDIPPSRIGIDISYYIYKFQASSEKILNFISECQSYGHKVILIFDGRSSDTKSSEIQKRRGIRDEESSHAKVLREQLDNPELTEEQHALLKKVIHQHENRGWFCTKEERHTLKKSLYEAYIPMLKSKGEADWLLTSLSVARDIDIVISADMDLLVLGAHEQLIPTQTNTFRRFKREDILDALGITDTQFRAFCSLCSSECEASRTDIRQAYHGIRIYKTIEALKVKHPEWMASWPEESPLLKTYSDPKEWIREDEEERYKSWKETHTMIYEPF